MQVLTEGQYLRHDLFGVGYVVEADVERTTIHFDDHGTKKFVTSLLKAEPMGDTPAKSVRPKRRKKAVKAAAA